MKIEPSRRSFLAGTIAVLVTAPAIVRAASLMPVKVMRVPVTVKINVYVNPATLEWERHGALGGVSNPFPTIRQALDFVAKNGGAAESRINLSSGVHPGGTILMPPGEHQIISGEGVTKITNLRLSSQNKTAPLFVARGGTLDLSGSYIEWPFQEGMSAQFDARAKDSA